MDKSKDVDDSLVYYYIHKCVFTL